MGDPINREIMRAYHDLRSLAEGMPDSLIGQAAKLWHDELGRTTERGGPLVAFVARGHELTNPLLVASAETFVRAIETSPEYKQPTFRCLGDYRAAVTSGESKVLAGLLLATCVLNEFAKFSIVFPGSKS